MLEELETSKDDYCRPLSISKDQKLELHLKRKPNSCFVNNYYDVAIKTDIQPVLNEYNAVTCMCQIFSKTEDQCLQAINQGVVCSGGSLQCFARIKAQENLPGCIFQSSREKSSSITF